MKSPVVEVKGLGKSYPLKGEPFWAFRDISFQLEPGDVLGIVGRNGAGKTTLLRVLARITDPTEGGAVVRGRIGALLETGTGFHDELSGRENIYLNGAILGMSPAEVRRKFDEIVDFSGVEKFIDAPVKSYSSGMRSRLAFSVAAHLETEILLVDEVLAVGDIGFQEKCLSKMNDLTQSRARTILFVSHSMNAVQSLCNRAILLEGGAIHTEGGTDHVVRAYHDLMLGSHGRSDFKSSAGRSGTGSLRFTGMRLEDLSGRPQLSVPAGGGVRLIFDFESQLAEPPDEIIITVVFIGSKGLRLFGLPSDVLRADLAAVGRTGSFVCELSKLPLLPGNYDLVVSCLVDRQLTDKLTNLCHVTVSKGDPFGTRRLPASQFGDGLVDFRWSVAGESAGKDALLLKTGKETNGGPTH